jgi:hypothetical protein
MPRMLRRAAVLGATAHVAGKRGAARAQEQAAASQPVAPATPAPTTAAQGDPYAQLEQAKKLLDQGIITQAEFDVQKKKILGGM